MRAHTLRKIKTSSTHSWGSAIFKSFHIKMLTKVSSTIRSSEGGLNTGDLFISSAEDAFKAEKLVLCKTRCRGCLTPSPWAVTPPAMNHEGSKGRTMSRIPSVPHKRGICPASPGETSPPPLPPLSHSFLPSSPLQSVKREKNKRDTPNKNRCVLC